MVSLMKWSDDLLIHVDDIDDQHRNLFLIINRLIVHKKTNGPREELLDFLHVLVAYSQAHFRTEAQHMADAHYPLAQEHSEEHVEFTQTIQAFMRDYDKGTEDLCDKMLTFLRLWWLSHVADADQKFGEYLKEEGYVP
ncbi:hemerythrin [Desulfoluna limicola]|uniref:Hemerythrin n=1 Tax=Desulfoluna limicola TaxID=2810562 RepID=A0ABM7PI44_9BACT|nr:bacteriohemerythrin [Desulfoluna limicola]BCS97250.1 hemerythrin [Desulfoluna limicola]